VPNIERCGLLGSEFSVSEPPLLATLTTRAAGCSLQQREHRLGDGDDAVHVGLEHRVDLVEGCDAQAAGLHDLFQRSVFGHGRVRDAGIVDEHVEPVELVPDALRCGGDGGLVGDVELDCASIPADAFRGRLSVLEVARPDEHGEAVDCEVLGDL
jgi:hypothetical protein